MYHSNVVFFVVSFLPAAVYASPGPAQTQYGNIAYENLLGMSPAPTPAPKRRDDAARLFRRQETQAPETCGFDDEDWYDPVTCNGADYTCYFNTDSDWFGCCTDAVCEDRMNTWCVPSTSATELTSSTNTLYCTFGTLTECYTWLNVWSSVGYTFTNYGCDSISSVDVVYFEATNGPTSTSTSRTSSSSSTTPSTTSTSSPTPSPTPPSTPPSTPSSTTTTSSSPTPTKKEDKPVPVGAIAGGAAGGFVLIAVIAFGAFFFWRRNKANSAPAAAAHSQPEYTNPQGHTSTYMNPPPGWTPQVNQYPPQTSQYPPQMVGQYPPTGVQTQSPDPPVSPTSTLMGQASPYSLPSSPSPESPYKQFHHDPNVSQLP